MRIQCMAWPTPEARCSGDASSIGHGLYLCIQCQERAQKDLLMLRRQRIRADRELARVAYGAAGPYRPQMDIRKGSMRTEVSGGLPTLGKDR